MRTSLLSASTVLTVAAAFLAGSPQASAEFVTLRYDHATSNPSVSTNLQANAPTGPFYWTENNLPPNTSFPPPTATFCIELATGQGIPTAGTNVIFDVRSLSAAPTLSSSTNANAITEFYGRFFDTAWNS